MLFTPFFVMSLRTAYACEWHLATIRCNACIAISVANWRRKWLLNFNNSDAYRADVCVRSCLFVAYFAFT